LNCGSLKKQNKTTTIKCYHVQGYAFDIHISKIKPTSFESLQQKQKQPDSSKTLYSLNVFMILFKNPLSFIHI
jgi:hypothetical protein